jgi:predicted ester cyclase
MSNDQLVSAWLKLWNGDFGQADLCLSPDFRVHAAMLDGGDGSAVAGPRGVVGWIGQTRAAIPDLTFTIQVGPIEQDDHVALRWAAAGTYAGGFPGAEAPAGTPVAFTGTDILRIHEGRLAEYWVNSDMLVLLAQLQVKTTA